MNLFIQVENEQTVNHPALEENLLQVFGKIPENWEPFERIERPTPNVYEVLESEQPVYQKVDGVWKDVWALRSMTDVEKSVKQQAIKDIWESREYAANWSTWVFNEDICDYEPPIARPEPDQSKIEANIFTFWSGVDNSWKDTPPLPQDDKRYKFDFFEWTWKEIPLP